MRLKDNVFVPGRARAVVVVEKGQEEILEAEQMLQEQGGGK